MLFDTYTSEECANIDFAVGVVSATLTSKVSGGLVTSLLIVNEVVLFIFFSHSFTTLVKFVVLSETTTNSEFEFKL